MIETAMGHTVLNRSIGGNTTADLMGRFQIDLVPTKPRYVLIGLSLANEGLTDQSNAAACQTVYDLSILKVSRIWQRGVRIVVTSPLSVSVILTMITPHSITYISRR